MHGNSLGERAEREQRIVQPLHEGSYRQSIEDERPSLWEPADSDRFSIVELTAPPLPMKFALAPYLPAGCPAILTGAGGTSKTGTMTMLAIAICAELELFGEPVDLGRVLIVTAEDRREMLRRHVYANSRDLNPKQRKLVHENLFVKDCVGSGFKLTRHIGGQTETATDVADLIEFSQTIEGLSLVVFDTLSRLNGGEESNEDLARFIESMERVSVQTGAATLALHHSGKAQLREGANDQYSGRGGSSLSDNARSVMHIACIGKEMKGAPKNARELIANGRLLRLSHVKSNYSAPAADQYLERVATPYAARLAPFRAEFGKNELAETWNGIAKWMATQDEVPYPNAGSIDSLGPEFGSRTDKRSALSWAMDRELVSEVDHPEPKGRRKTYLSLSAKPADVDDAKEYAKASKGD